MKIAKRNPFSGVPVIHTPAVFGASTGKQFLYRIPVTGQRPIVISAENLPKGVSLCDGILSGTVDNDCEFCIKLCAENSEGKTTKIFNIRIAHDGMLRTPLMGYTTWNAYDSRVTQEDVERDASLLIESGIADYGYGYVNVDSGWQKYYGGEFDAVVANDKFPDMKGMCEKIHSLGLKCGIYSTPMLTAWGCPKEFESVPGCTRGEADPRFPDVPNGGIGIERMEANNVRQWEEWGFDYLKYDFMPADAYNVDLMKRELLKSKREFALCVTVRARIEDAEYFKNNVCSWRDNEDSLPTWANIVERIDTLDKWKDYVCPGHFYDLDMLTVGKWKEDPCIPDIDERDELFVYTMCAFFSSPIQISSPIDGFTETELDIICNEEMIAINQDSIADYPTLVKGEETLRIYKRNLENKDIAYAVFNLSEDERSVSLNLPKNNKIRNIWLKENIKSTTQLDVKVEPHGVFVIRVTPV